MTFRPPFRPPCEPNSVPHSNPLLSYTNPPSEPLPFLPPYPCSALRLLRVSSSAWKYHQPATVVGIADMKSRPMVHEREVWCPEHAAELQNLVLNEEMATNVRH